MPSKAKAVAAGCVAAVGGLVLGPATYVLEAADHALTAVGQLGAGIAYSLTGNFKKAGHHLKECGRETAYTLGMGTLGLIYGACTPFVGAKLSYHHTHNHLMGTAHPTDTEMSTWTKLQLTACKIVADNRVFGGEESDSHKKAYQGAFSQTVNRLLDKRMTHLVERSWRAPAHEQATADDQKATKHQAVHDAFTAPDDAHEALYTRALGTYGKQNIKEAAKITRDGPGKHGHMKHGQTCLPAVFIHEEADFFPVQGVGHLMISTKDNISQDTTGKPVIYGQDVWTENRYERPTFGKEKSTTVHANHATGDYPDINTLKHSHHAQGRVDQTRYNEVSLARVTEEDVAGYYIASEFGIPAKDVEKLLFYRQCDALRGIDTSDLPVVEVKYSGMDARKVDISQRRPDIEQLDFTEFFLARLQKEHEQGHDITPHVCHVIEGFYWAKNGGQRTHFTPPNQATEDFVQGLTGRIKQQFPHKPATVAAAKYEYRQKNVQYSLEQHVITEMRASQTTSEFTHAGPSSEKGDARGTQATKMWLPPDSEKGTRERWVTLARRPVAYSASRERKPKDSLMIQDSLNGLGRPLSRRELLDTMSHLRDLNERDAQAEEMCRTL